MGKVTSGITPILLLMGMLNLASSIQQAKAGRTIYIRADGSIDPPTAPILRIGDLYVVTDNINESIVIQRNNMTLEGAGFTIQGGGDGNGVELQGISNVTIKNTMIFKFNFGIYVNCSYNIMLFNNYIRENSWGGGIGIENSSDNAIFDNDIGMMEWSNGIYIGHSSNNNISGNKIDTISMGSCVYLRSASNNNIWDNDLELSNCGISFDFSSDNNLTRNNVIGNTDEGVRISLSSNNNIIGNRIMANNQDGILLVTSSNNSILSNNITSHNYNGILLCIRSYNNSIAGNDIYYNNYAGILTSYSNSNRIADNNIMNSENGLLFWNSAGNTLTRNNVTASYLYGIGFENSSSNFIFHNNFINNTNQAYDINSINVWDDGYPSGGNYWSDQEHGFCADHYRGPDQNEPKSDDSPDGIVDKPYVIDDNNRDEYPLMKPYGGQHDIGINNVTISKNIVGQGYSVQVNVRVLNYGVNNETFNLTVYCNTTSIALQKITITGRNSMIATFTWTVPDIAIGNYTIWAYATPVPGEADTADNTFTDGWVYVGLIGDVNGDGIVDIEDVYKISLAYGSVRINLEYWHPIRCDTCPHSPNLDINGDGIIDIEDIYTTALHYGEMGP